MKEEAKGLLGLPPYRILDLTDAQGFACGKVLGDLGADVIKIERPGGDPARDIGPFYQRTHDPEKSFYWLAFNTSKRGITLNVETARGQEIFKRLVETADFVIESFPPGYMANLGLGYEDLARIRPSLIMTSISPFGQTGPRSHYKGSDLIGEATGGIMYISGSPERGPLAPVSYQYAFTHAGLQAAVGSLIANYWRQQTGEGQHVDISIQEAVIFTIYPPVELWADSQVIQSRYGTKLLRTQTVLGELVWRCKNGYVLWRLMTGALGHRTQALSDWMEEEGKGGGLTGIDWVSIDSAEYSQEQLIAWEKDFASFFLTKTKEEIFAEARRRGIMIFPVNDVGEVWKDEQLKYRCFWQEVYHDELGIALTYPGLPFKIPEADFKLKRAPLIGEHNEAIYCGELGMTKGELNSLSQANII